MRQRPWILVVLAGLHFVAPVGNITLNALLVNRNVFDYFTYAMQAEYLQRNWFIIIGPLVAAIAIYACKKWSFFVYLVAITTLFVFSYSGYISKADSISILPVIFVYLVNVSVVSYFLLPAVRQVYFDPRLRWWESQPRYRCDFQCSWSKDESESSGHIGNFSINGLFLKSNKFPEDGSEIKVTIKSPENGDMSFIGQAILHGRQDAVGFGVKFNHSKQSLSQAKIIVKSLHEKGMELKYRSQDNSDSFSYWLKNLMTTGNGILPKKDK